VTRKILTVIFSAWYSLRNIVYRALKFGLVTLGLGLLCFLVLYGVYGGVGPCALPGQLTTILLGISFTGIGGLVCLVSLPVVLVRKYKTRTEYRRTRTEGDSQPSAS
jgi:hypothetical protein